ncbi:MAG: hypothetical protein JWO98_1177 [Frankiales bacterium]|nr:hypothetical protein [Frankiales bacterium]
MSRRSSPSNGSLPGPVRSVDAALTQMPAGQRPQVLITTDEGITGDVLIQRSQDARLLVVGSRSRNQVEGVVLGSVALHCVVSAACPGMVVHPYDDGRPAAVADTSASSRIMSPHV